jgi:4-hydroxy-tetrahydrodipicolinate synthase
MAMKIGRLLTAMVTPFNERGEVDFFQAGELAQALIASGSDGIVVAGTTGESPTLSGDEKLELFRATKKSIGDKGVVIAGVGNYNTKESVELAHLAEATGVDGVMAVVPYYNKPPQEGLFQHFKAIASSTHLPVILYNVPSRTSLNMTYETTIRLSSIDNIVGVKEAGSDLDQIARILDKAPDGFKVWSGNDNETLPIMAMGGFGIVSVAAHLVGMQIKRLIDSILSGRMEEAKREHLRLHSLFKVLFVVSNPIPVKYSLNKIGFPVGSPRLPLVHPDSQTAQMIDSVLAETTIDLSVNQLA